MNKSNEIKQTQRSLKQTNSQSQKSLRESLIIQKKGLRLSVQSIKGKKNNKQKDFPLQLFKCNVLCGFDSEQVKKSEDDFYLEDFNHSIQWLLSSDVSINVEAGKYRSLNSSPTPSPKKLRKPNTPVNTLSHFDKLIAEKSLKPKGIMLLSESPVQSKKNKKQQKTQNNSHHYHHLKNYSHNIAQSSVKLFPTGFLNTQQKNLIFNCTNNNKIK